MELVVGSVISVLASIALWALLPRGVVLTRSTRTQNFRGELMYDTWELHNNSALPVQIVSVTYSSVNTYDDEKRTIRELELPPEANRDTHGITLEFDDHVLEGVRTDWGRPWKGLRVPPGDTLQAIVLGNVTLRVRYRRAGPFGVLERREVVVHGYA